MQLNIRFDFHNDDSVPLIYDKNGDIQGGRLSDFLSEVVERLPGEITANHEYDILVNHNEVFAPDSESDNVEYYPDSDYLLHLGTITIEEIE